MFDSLIQLQHEFLCEYLNYVQIEDSINSNHLTPRVAEGTCQTNTKQNILTPIIAGELKDRGNSLSRIISSSGHFVHFLCSNNYFGRPFSSPYIQKMHTYLSLLSSTWHSRDDIWYSSVTWRVSIYSTYYFPSLLATSLWW